MMNWGSGSAARTPPRHVRRTAPSHRDGGLDGIGAARKNLVKSGGEGISSVDMEGDIMAMPQVAEAAVIAVPDEKWQERPLACVVPGPGQQVTVEAVRHHLEAQGWARWQLPERVEILDEIPKTAVGKFDKKALRARLAPAPAQA